MTQTIQPIVGNYDRDSGALLGIGPDRGPFISIGGGGSGTVTSVAGHPPDGTGNVAVNSADLGDINSYDLVNNNVPVKNAIATIPTSAQAIGAVPSSGGTYNAATNTPARTSGVAPADGVICLTVSVAGVMNIASVPTQLNVNDEIYWNGTDYVVVGGVQPGNVVQKSTTDGRLVPAVVGTDYDMSAILLGGVPFVIPSSGTVGANGSVTGLTAFGASDIFKGMFYFPQGALNATSGQPGYAAGWYYGEVTSTTTLTAYNNMYTSGSPVRPSKTTFSGTTGAAYTQITTQVDSVITTMAANSLGPNGYVRQGFILRNNNSANTKTLKGRFGSFSEGVSVAPTTLTSTAGGAKIWNTGVTNEQFYLPTDIATTGVTNTLTASTVDTTAALAIGFAMTLANASDWMALVQYEAFAKYHS